MQLTYVHVIVSEIADKTGQIQSRPVFVLPNAKDWQQAVDDKIKELSEMYPYHKFYTATIPVG
jgi:hypothetical protein